MSELKTAPTRRPSTPSGQGALPALVSAAGAGGLFLGCWLGLGVPLAFSAAAGAIGYGGLYLMLVLGRAAKPEPRIGEYVDKELAKKTVAQAEAAATALDGLCAAFAKNDKLLPGFRRIAELLRAIARDVADDPKDAASAAVFIAMQGETVPRIARIALDLQKRGASPDQLAQARARIGAALNNLIAAHEKHLEHLQEDNLAELQAELDVLEANLSFSDDLERELGGTAPKPRTP